VQVDENVMDSPTHKVDCYKNRVALEIEGGGGAGCPILVFGISKTLYDENC